MRIVLVLVSVVGLGTVIATFLVGSGHYEPTVVREPYETGLRWDAERKERERSGWRVSVPKRNLTTGKQDLLIVVSDRSGQALDDAVVEVQFLRPFSAVADRAFRAGQLPSGAFRVSVDIPERGRWDMLITVTQDDRRIVFEDTVYAD